MPLVRTAAVFGGAAEKIPRRAPGYGVFQPRTWCQMTRLSSPAGPHRERPNAIGAKPEPLFSPDPRWLSRARLRRTKIASARQTCRESDRPYPEKRRAYRLRSNRTALTG